MNLLEGRDLTRRFGDVTAVDGVDIEVGEGEIVGLVGANGAGKTTLIRLHLGLLAPTSGSALLFGSEPRREGRAKVGYVPQHGGLYDDLTVAENASFSARAFGSPGGGTLPPGLPDGAGRLVADLSLGVRRRVAFGLALGHEPRLLVLDEPTSGVDPLQRAHLWDTIRAAAERGLGVLVTTHHMSEATECDRLVVLSMGRVVARGTEGGIVGDQTVVEVRSPRWPDAFNVLQSSGLMVSLAGRSIRVVDAQPEHVAAVLSAAGISAELGSRPASLDEVFVRLSSSPAV
jgi:ABC-2 type transport system ATP-binding protein